MARKFSFATVKSTVPMDRDTHVTDDFSYRLYAIAVDDKTLAVVLVDEFKSRNGVRRTDLVTGTIESPQGKNN